MSLHAMHEMSTCLHCPNLWQALKGTESSPFQDSCTRMRSLHHRDARASFHTRVHTSVRRLRCLRRGVRATPAPRTASCLQPGDGCNTPCAPWGGYLMEGRCSLFWECFRLCRQPCPMCQGGFRLPMPTAYQLKSTLFEHHPVRQWYAPSPHELHSHGRPCASLGLHWLVELELVPCHRADQSCSTGWWVSQAA